MREPAVSVVLAVRDGEAYIAEAVGSVLAQDFADFELIVVDDGSTDRTGALVRAFEDARLRLVGQAGVGLTVALNRGIALARAPLIARMDADDVARPRRLGRQVAALDAEAGLGLLGTACEEIDARGRGVRTFVPPLDDAAIRRALIRANPFVHSSVVFRRTVFDAAGGYDERFTVAQDYDLWMRMSRITRMGNLPEPLVQRRLTPTMVSRARARARRRAELSIRLRELRAGAYPSWCAIHLFRPLAGLLVPARLDRRLGRRGCL